MVFGTIAAGAQTGMGAYQWYKGKKKEDSLTRPVYEIPAEMKQYLSAAEVSALQGLPEEQRQQYLDNVSRTMTTGLYNLNSRAAGIEGTSGLAAQANDANKNLLVADANARMGNQQRLQNARQGYAEYEDKVFGLNKYDPYMQDLNYARALQGAGQQNFQGGLNKGAEMEQKHMESSTNLVSGMLKGI